MPGAGARDLEAAGETAFAVFLDFDGTLVDIAGRPDGVEVPPTLVPALHALRRQCGGAVAIVTGRAVAAIEGFLPGLELDICGLHGMERRVGGRTCRIAVDNLTSFRAAVARIAEPLRAIENVVVEDKGESLALHWRQAPAAEPRLRAAAAELAVEGFRVQAGKAVVEVVPAASGKGAAVEALMQEPPYRGRMPVFVGDDVTDEHGFAAANRLGGISVKVGPGDTVAGRRLASPEAVRRMLDDPAGFVRHISDLECAIRGCNMKA